MFTLTTVAFLHVTVPDPVCERRPAAADPRPDHHAQTLPRREGPARIYRYR